MNTESLVRRTPRLLPVAALAAFSPLMAEFVLGDQYLAGTMNPGMQLGEFVVFVLWYGMAAVLIRELARRTGRGWPTILLLALGFALVEEGLLTQSLFNPHYLGLDLLGYGYVGWLGTATPWAIFVLTIHVVWSMATPIALIEAVFPGPVSGPAAERFLARHPEHTVGPLPWLGRVGLGVVAGVAVVGALAILGVSWISDQNHFVAHPVQLIGAALLAAIAVAAGLLIRPAPSGVTRRPWLPAALVALVLGTAFEVLRYVLPDHVPAAVTSLVLVVLIVAMVVLAVRFRLDVTGLAVGAAATYAWVGMRAAAGVGVPGLMEQSVIVLVVAAVVVLALRRRARSTSISDRNKPDQNRRSSASSIPRSAS